MTPIRCELFGSGTAQAGDLISRGHSPVLDLCRKLVAAGYDPRLPMQCFRCDTIALRVRSIGEGAKLTVRETATRGPRVVPWRAFPSGAVTAPVGLIGLGVADHVGTPQRNADRYRARERAQP